MIETARLLSHVGISSGVYPFSRRAGRGSRLASLLVWYIVKALPILLQQLQNSISVCAMDLAS